ncbi:MerR family transcriptional regulator [Pseudosulfitobacter pseudonitzschiae]|uniref:MerR family transcriptional regulator n=1 Tax=Pseudosulfitobacter pseudonitzschiae TaxID=1402135 RepID=UPI001AF042D5|nr:MerR family transcriptional regulator [Pseudosulfitobacter pseudonitzschiae]MBM1814610.1 MerR family transcriptional regulator [Pseudosulfitobacter pseudonitzschiae]MBM1831604.1 MerR family transcriptional regulator [Pseudosulfitobacter pseudonitzschiae]MBM1836469.1 MerR family transcriptional regulator [Pseudosulfitobacter pseudonitzschiae]MBM1841316.1 MerR family transcriptional regulator [Pseudosulfitobacter pseudonitzschiae]MBM1846183.1 MerR family transcriptional regulator [Pseudosulfi
MSKSPDAFRTISEVADWLGVQAHVLRFWESKFSQVKPVKRAGGRRYYRPADMLLLGGIRKLLHDDGLTIKGVQKILREQGMAYVSDLSLPLDDDVMEALEAATPERPAAPFSDPPPPEPEPMVGEVVEFPTTPEPVAAPAADIPEPPAAAPPPMPPDAAVEVQEDETPDAEPEEIAEPPAADAPVADAPAADADEQPSDTAPEPLTAAPPPVTPDEIAQTQDPSQEPEGIEEAVEDTVEPGQSFDSVAEIESDDTPAHDTPAHDPQPAPEESAPETDVAPAPLDHAAVAQDDAPPVDASAEPNESATADQHDQSSAVTPTDNAPETAEAEETPADPTPATESEPDKPAESAVPAFLSTSKMASDPDAAPSEPAPAPTPKPRVVDAPDPPAEDQIETTPGLLAALARATQIAPDHQNTLRPMLAQLTALRDRMASARKPRS